MSRFRALALNLLLSLVVLAVMAGVLEAVCRLVEEAPPRPPVADYLWDWEQKWDGDFYVFNSDAVGWPPWEEFNADGVRDRTHAVDKPEGTFRLVFLGDSVTLGDQIRPDQAYPQVIQQRFDERGVPVEVFNVGLLGWSTRQERIAYDTIVRKYRPDEVVLAVCLNDIPELQNNLSRPPRWLSSLHARSALVRRVVGAEGREIASVEEMFREPASPKVRRAMELFFTEVRTLRDAVQADGASFALLVFPFRFQVEPGAPAPSVQEEIATFAESERIPILDVLPPLARVGPSAFVDYDHLSPRGARDVADAFLGSGLAPPVPAHDAVLGPGERSVAFLRSALRDLEAPRRAAAAWALGRRLADAGTAGALAALLADPSPLVRAEAARALGAAGAREKAGDLFARLDDEATAVRWRAAEALHALKPEAAHVPALAAAVKSRDPYIRGFAIWTLGNLGQAAEPAVPALVAALDEEDAYGRAGAALALGKIGSASRIAVPRLVEALRGTDADRRWKAARALGRIGRDASDGVPALLEATRDESQRVRAQAVRALGRVAPGRAEVAAALRRAMEDDDAGVRRAATAALTGR